MKVERQILIIVCGYRPAPRNGCPLAMIVKGGRFAAFWIGPGGFDQGRLAGTSFSGCQDGGSAVFDANGHAGWTVLAHRAAEILSASARYWKIMCRMFHACELRWAQAG